MEDLLLRLDLFRGWLMSDVRVLCSAPVLCTPLAPSMLVKIDNQNSNVRILGCCDLMPVKLNLELYDELKVSIEQYF